MNEYTIKTKEEEAKNYIESIIRTRDFYHKELKVVSEDRDEAKKLNQKMLGILFMAMETEDKDIKKFISKEVKELKKEFIK